MKSYVHIALCFFLTCPIFCQEGEQILYRIANDVIKQTSFEVKDTIEASNPTRYNLWRYQNFMVLEGMDNLFEATQNNAYKSYSDKNIDYFSEFQTKFGDKLVPQTYKKGRLNFYSKPREIWQSGLVASFAERSKEKPKVPEFNRGMEILDKFLENVPRLIDGTLMRNAGKPKRKFVQIDDLYMLVPYWCRKSKLLNDNSWLERAIEEAIHYDQHLWDGDHSLMRGRYYADTKEQFGLFWGRGNGWYIMALTDLLTFVPENHPKRELLLSHYKKFIDGIIKRQNENGLWHQVLDQPEVYTEASCSGMFTYCILKGVNEGWLTPDYLAFGIKGWKGLLTKVDDNYFIKDVCPSSGISDDLNYYVKRRTVHDQHAIGPFILAGAEYLKVQ